MKLCKESVNHLSKPSAPFITGSIAYTKPLFRLVKCMILALPWSLTSVWMQSRMKVLMVSRFWTCDHVLRVEE